jgi:hypothetical protein
MRPSIASAFLLLAGSCTGAPGEPACPAAEARACLVDQQACTLVGSVATCVRCDVGTRANVEGRCAPIPGIAMPHAFPEIESGPGTEQIGECRTWTLGNETDIWVQSVELVQTEASHHSNWLFVPEGTYPGPDGIWRCDDRGYDQLNAALAGGVLYAQSTQASHEVQQFPSGAAVRIPAHSVIVSDIHILNTTTETVRGQATLTIYTIPREEVLVPLAPFHITYHALDIPARSRSRFEASCDLGPAFVDAVGAPPAWRLFYSLPHTHSLGTRVFLEAIGGPLDGTSLIDVAGYNGEARGIAHDPPVDLTGVTGFRFGCEFDNPRPENVGWGIGDQEMCEMLGFIESDGAFESQITSTTSTTMDGSIVVHSGPCSNFVIPWMDRL